MGDYTQLIPVSFFEGKPGSFVVNGRVLFSDRDRAKKYSSSNDRLYTVYVMYIIMKERETDGILLSVPYLNIYIIDSDGDVYSEEIDISSGTYTVRFTSEVTEIEDEVSEREEEDLPDGSPDPVQSDESSDE